MKAKEQQLLDEKAKKDAAKKQSSDNAQATKYHKDEKQRIRAMLDEARHDGISIQAATQFQFSS